MLHRRRHADEHHVRLHPLSGHRLRERGLRVCALRRLAVRSRFDHSGDLRLVRRTVLAGDKRFALLQEADVVEVHRRAIRMERVEAELRDLRARLLRLVGPARQLHDPRRLADRRVETAALAVRAVDAVVELVARRRDVQVQLLGVLARVHHVDHEPVVRREVRLGDLDGEAHAVRLVPRDPERMAAGRGELLHDLRLRTAKRHRRIRRLQVGRLEVDHRARAGDLHARRVRKRVRSLHVRKRDGRARRGHKNCCYVHVAFTASSSRAARRGRKGARRNHCRRHRSCLSRQTIHGMQNASTH